jgi:hypothetical protein
MTNQSNLQTAEEILDSHYESGMHWKSVNRAKVLAAMESYASQSLPQQPVPKDFIEYMTNSRKEFVDAVLSYLVSDNNLHTKCDSLLICFDQMKDRLLVNSPSAGLRWVKDGSVLFADWINKNHVVQNYVGDWLWNFLGKHYTTAELYDVFLEDSKKYPTPPTK